MPCSTIAARSISTSARVDSITDQAVACGLVLISSWPPGSKEMRVLSGRVHEGGSSPAGCSVQPSRFARRERTSAVDGFSPRIARAGKDVLEYRTIVLVAQLRANALALLERDFADLWYHHLVCALGNQVHFHPVVLTTIECAVVVLGDRKISAELPVQPPQDVEIE